MSPKLIEPHDAAYRLAREWNIPHPAAEQIVKGVLLSEQCIVVGKPPSGPLQDVSKAIAAAIRATYMPSTSMIMIPWGFTDVKMDWRGVLEHGRPLVPAIWEHAVAEAEDGPADMPPLKSNDEFRAVEFLAPRLQENTKRDDAWKMVATKFPTLSKRGFDERVWPNARVRAGFRAAALPGPKPKRNRCP
jgi:hypothetical protein